MNEKFSELAVTVPGIAAEPPQYIHLDFDGVEFRRLHSPLRSCSSW